MSDRAEQTLHLVQYGWKIYRVRSVGYLVWNAQLRYGFTENGDRITRPPRVREERWKNVPDYHIDDFYSYARRTPGT